MTGAIIKIKTFNNEIIIRPPLKGDLPVARKFQSFINSLVEEKAMITTNRKMTLKQEIGFLKNELKQVKNKKVIKLIAEDKEKKIIAGMASTRLNSGNQGHVGILGILIAKNYRRMGLGTFLMREIIKSAKKELKPRPKIIRLSVYHTNKPALKLYKKFGFKKVARIPRQLQHKGKLLDEVVMILDL